MSKRLRIKSKPTRGWSSMVMRAATRNFPWKDIVSELIDNALANIQPGQPCSVRVAWDSKLGEFSVTDSGRGSEDIELFFRPGKTGGNHSPHGNSTFGTGLFAIECYLDGHLQVATECDRMLYVGQRTIADGMPAAAEEYTLREVRRKSFGIPNDGGTVVRFRGFRKRA
ncbi:MAG: ATP-binding protein, partial [Planctomycetaceae bacterium]|nr:ATP-binding protein [Planctomycetaceae bacterium]